MATQKVDLVVHVDETLGEERRRAIEKDLQNKNGVVWARFNDKRPHLMQVEYDPDIITSLDVLKEVMVVDGHAELIGPI